MCFVSENLRDDKTMVTQAIYGSAHAVMHASARLRNDPEVILAASSWYDEEENLAMMVAGCALKADRDFGLQAVELRGRDLESLSSELRGDRQIVMTAVRNEGLALPFASHKLRADWWVVAAAFEENPWAKDFAPAGRLVRATRIGDRTKGGGAPPLPLDAEALPCWLERVPLLVVEALPTASGGLCASTSR